MANAESGDKEQRRLKEEARFRQVLERIGRTPDAVIDIGVRRGTPWLYQAYGGVPFVLVDPQEGGEMLLTSKPDNFVFVNKAVGREAGKMTLNEQGAMSTFLERTTLTRVQVKKRYEVEVVTLDDIISRHLPDARKIGLKIDTEGFELEVLAGLDRHAGRIDFILSEASVLNRFENSYNFSELIGEMWKKDFRFYNILNNARPAAPRVYDCLFFRKDDAAFG